MPKDRFTIELQCPSCGKTGQADCWQEDGWAYQRGDHRTHVDSVTPGFRRVHVKSGYGDDINFKCEDCGKLSVPGS